MTIGLNIVIECRTVIFQEHSPERRYTRIFRINQLYYDPYEMTSGDSNIRKSPSGRVIVPLRRFPIERRKQKDETCPAPDETLKLLPKPAKIDGETW